MARIIEHFSEISGDYEAVFCDLWGVVHNGREAFPDAVAALQAFVGQGGHVVMLTNAPRPREPVAAQLDDLGVPRDAWSDIATSGDSARAAVASGAFGKKIYHLGPERDLAFFSTEPDMPGMAEIELVPLDQAQNVVCTGLIDDETETPEDYAAFFLEAKSRGLDLICANPDIVVDRGDDRIYCAGALAQEYTERGGTSHYFGKPHPPIYDLARNRLTAAAGRVIDDRRIIAIGDGIVTDVPGALGEGLDCLFVTGGLAAEETGTGQSPEAEKLEKFLQLHNLPVTAAIGRLR